MGFTPLGPGTLELGPTGTGTDFSCEILGGKVTHAYEELGSARTVLCGTERPATQKRTDGLNFSLENDLTAAGLYAFCLEADLTEVEFTYVPNTVAAASWAGIITIRLPADIGSDEFGSPLISSVEWTGVGPFTFTPAGTTPLKSDFATAS